MPGLNAAADDAEYPSRKYAWGVVALLTATAILSYTDRQVLSLLVDPIRHDLRIDDTHMGLLLGTAFAVVYGVAGIPLGWWADRTSRRNLIVAGVLVWSCGTVACGCARSFGELFLARIAVGVGEAVLSPAAISLISDYFPPARRASAVGVFLSGIAMGIGAAILIGGGVLYLVGTGHFAGLPAALQRPWRLVLLAIGIPGALWALVLLAIREPVRQTGPVAASTGPAGSSITLRSVSGYRLATVFLAVAMASLVDNAVAAWSPTLLIRHFGRDPARVGAELGLLITAGFGGGVLVGGWLADRAGAAGGWSRKLLVCLGGAGLIVPLSLAIDSSSPSVVTAAVAAYFSLSGIVTACGFAAILDAVPNRSRGLAMAVSFFLNVALGAGIGPPAVAIVAERLFAAALGPAITLVAFCGYTIAFTALSVTLLHMRRTGSSTVG